MIEFLAARWGCKPWELEGVPMVELLHWFPVSTENVADEGALGIGAALSKLLK